MIVALFLLAFALRVGNLGGQSIWLDEAFTWQMTSHGWDNFWHVLLTGDRNPPLYFVTVALWGGVAGWSEFSLRFLSVIYGVIGLAFFANLVKRLFGGNASVWAFAFGAFSPALTVYSQEGRMYAPFFALTAATLYFGSWVLDLGLTDQRLEIRDWRRAWPFLLSEMALLLTHYFAVPIVGAINLLMVAVLFRQRGNGKAYARWFGGQVLVALPLLVWTIIVLATPGSLTLAHEPSPDVATFAYQVGVLWMTSVRALDSTSAAWVLLAIGFIALASIGAWQVDRRSARWAIVFGVVSSGIAFALTGVLTSFHPRYLLPYSIPFFALIGASAAAVSSRRKTGFIVGGLVILVSIGSTLVGWLVASVPQYAKDDARGVAAYLDLHAIAGDVILIEANDYTLPYYYHGPATIRMITASTEGAALTQLSDAIGDAKRVWLAHWHISTQDPRGYWRFLLEQSGSLQDWTSYRGYELYHYAMQSAVHVPTLVERSAGEQSVVKAVSLIRSPADGALTLAMEWQPPVKYFDPAKVSVRLLDAYHERIASVDAPLLNEQGQMTDQWPALPSVTNYYVLPIPPGTPPSIYTVTVQLYNTRDVLAEEVLGQIQLPRRMVTADPYRTLAGYHWWTPTGNDLLPGLVLEAASVSATRAGVPPLGIVEVVLRWRKAGKASDVEPRLRLVQGDRALVEIGSDLFSSDYPFDRWASDEIVIDRLKLTYPPTRGATQLQVGQGDRWIDLVPLSLDTSGLKFEPPAVQHGQPVDFDDVARLIGYDLPVDSIGPDRPLDLTLYWRASNTEPITTSFTVFTQLIAPDGHLVAQHDAPPAPPTIAWVPGQVIADYHALRIVDATYRGPATLIVGWYNSATIVRLKTPRGDDYVALQTPVMVGDQ